MLLEPRPNLAKFPSVRELEVFDRVILNVGEETCRKIQKSMSPWCLGSTNNQSKELKSGITNLARTEVEGKQARDMEEKNTDFLVSGLRTEMSLCKFHRTRRGKGDAQV